MPRIGAERGSPMFEQDRYADSERRKGVFPDENDPATGMSRYRVSGSGDSEELAADRAADRVTGGLFRAPEGAAQSTGFEADLSDADLSGGGSPLPDTLMGSMEQSFGTNFSGVRLHTDAGADRASRSINARAFTRGQDIYFTSGSYDPDSREGQHLIAHELAHVAAGDSGIHRDTGDSAPGAIKISKSQVMEMAMVNSTDASKSDVAAANRFFTECGDMDSMAAEVRSGALGKESVQKRKGKSDQLKNSLNSGITDLEKSMADYVSESEKETGNAEAAKKSRKYQEAQAVLAEMRKARDQLTQKTDPDLQWIQNSLDAQTGNNTGSELPEQVDRMLSDPTCGQFFKAVADVRKGAAGEKNFDALNEQAVNSAANLHGNVEESSNDKVARRAGNVSTVNGIVGFGTDMASGASDINTDIKDDNMQKRDEDARIGTGVFSSGTALVGTTADTVGAAAQGKAVAAQEKARKAKIQELEQRNKAAGLDTGIGKTGSADHSGRVGAAAASVGALGGAVGFGSSVAGSFKSTNETAGEVNNAMGVAASSISTAGDIMGLSAQHAQAKEAAKRDAAAKSSMKTLGKKLRSTIPTPPVEEKDQALAGICDRLQKDKFNSGAAREQQLSALLTATLGRQDLSEEQKKLLTTLKALEVSRAASKEEASSGRKDMISGALSLAGNIVGLIANAMKAAKDSLGQAGTILGMVASGVSLISNVMGVKDMAQDKEEKRQQARNEERDAKVEACKSAIGQMAMLPPLSLDVLRISQQTKQPLPAPQLDAAEQYAAVFSIIESANVEMTDILYAIEMGGFGSDVAPGQKKSLQDSLNDTYTKLSFIS